MSTDKKIEELLEIKTFNLSLFERSSKTDDRRNKDYYIRTSTYPPEVEWAAQDEFGSDLRNARSGARPTNLWSYCGELPETFPGAGDLSVQYGDDPGRMVVIVSAPKPSQLPMEQEVVAWANDILGHFDREQYIEDWTAALREDFLSRYAFRWAHMIHSHIQRAAQDKACEITRYKQRLAALEAEYEAETKIQLAKEIQAAQEGEHREKMGEAVAGLVDMILDGVGYHTSAPGGLFDVDNLVDQRAQVLVQAGKLSHNYWRNPLSSD